MNIPTNFISKLRRQIPTDKSKVLELLSSNGSMLEYVDKIYRSDKTAVECAVKNNGSALLCASKEFQQARELIMLAVGTYAQILQDNTFSKFKNDREIILNAVEHNYESIQYSSRQLQFDTEIIACAVLKSLVQCDKYKTQNFLTFFSPELRDHRPFVFLSIQTFAGCLIGASDRLKDDFNLVAVAIYHDNFAFGHKSGQYYASSRLRDTKELVMFALMRGMPMDFASNRLQKDTEVIEHFKKMTECNT